MLVIISDLHLTDGTTGLRIPSGAFRVFRERLADMAYDASKRDEDIYKPIKEFDLVLLGDIFDLLRSTQWNNEVEGEAGFARPWTKTDDPALAQKIENIVDGILQKNAQSLAVLRDLANGTGISLPPPTKKGQVDRRVSRDPRSNSRLPVKVNIHYMCGNHDWYLHLEGSKFDQIREKVVQQLGLQNPSTRFPHNSDESKIIQSIFNSHKVTARHGDIYDPYNFVEKKGRNYPSVGDALVIELFNRIPQLIRGDARLHLSPEFYDELDEMGSIRPSTMTPVWIAGMLEKHNVQENQKKIINEIWHNLLDEFLDLKFLSDLDQPWIIDPVDKAEALINIFRHFSLETLDNFAPTAEKLINIHASLGGGGEFGFDENAMKEPAYKKEEARFIVFGHTHGFKVVPLRTVSKNGKILEQIYINTGTWHPLHELAKADPKKRGFIMHKTMSYVGFYREDERKGRSFETWTGALDL